MMPVGQSSPMFIVNRLSPLQVFSGRGSLFDGVLARDGDCIVDSHRYTRY